MLLPTCHDDITCEGAGKQGKVKGRRQYLTQAQVRVETSRGWGCCSVGEHLCGSWYYTHPHILEMNPRMRCLGMMAHLCNLSTKEAEAGGPPQAQDQPELYRKPLTPSSSCEQPLATAGESPLQPQTLLPYLPSWRKKHLTAANLYPSIDLCPLWG